MYKYRTHQTIDTNHSEVAKAWASIGQVDPDDTELPDPAHAHQVSQVAGQHGGDTPDTVTEHHFIRIVRMAGVFDCEDLEICCQVLDVLFSVFTILLENRMNMGRWNSPD